MITGSMTPDFETPDAYAKHTIDANHAVRNPPGIVWRRGTFRHLLYKTKFLFSKCIATTAITMSHISCLLISLSLMRKQLFLYQSHTIAPVRFSIANCTSSSEAEKKENPQVQIQSETSGSGWSQAVSPQAVSPLLRNTRRLNLVTASYFYVHGPNMMLVVTMVSGIHLGLIEKKTLPDTSFKKPKSSNASLLQQSPWTIYCVY